MQDHSTDGHSLWGEPILPPDKVCSTCHKRKLLTDFPRTRDNGRYIRRCECKECWKERKLAHGRTEAGRRKARDTFLKTRYRISLKQYEAMLEAQQSLCAICGRVCPTGRVLSVDHCHRTGKVRALLCAPCNTGIGIVENFPDFLRKAAEYLERFRST